MGVIMGEEMEKEFKKKCYRNSLRLFLIFIVGCFLLLTEIKFFAFFGGIGIVYSILGFLVNADFIKQGASG